MKKSLSVFIAVVVGLLLLAAVIFFAWISFKNGIIRQREDIDAEWSQVENQLKRRADLIPNLVNTVKGFAAHETEAIAAVTEARARLGGAGNTIADRAKSENELSSALSRLLVVVENYPNLKADQNFRQLSDELAGTENRIAVARRAYNEAVRAYNTKIKQFPGSLLGLETCEYFEIAEADKAVPKVEF
ncbi:MAG: LemA family protein [Lentisphaerae bacterium]|jgi:LemA protein|nr:LemA family protein [Lentisphaerota bacterium]